MRPSEKQIHARLMVLKFVVVHALSTPPREMLAELHNQWPESDRSDFGRKCQSQAESNIKALHKASLWNHASPTERAFLKSSGSMMDEQAQIDASWRMESAGMIMWALGFTNSLPPIDEQQSPDLLKSVDLQKVGIFTKHPRLRPRRDISHCRSLMEMWHWRVRTRQMIEEGIHFDPDEAMKNAGLHTLDDIVRMSAKDAHERGDIPKIADEDYGFLGKPFREISKEEYALATSIIKERHYALNWLCGMAPRNKWDETPTDT